MEMVLPPEASAEKELLQSQDILSLVVIPMSSGGFPIGFIGFDSVRMAKTWSKVDIAMLKTLGEIVASAMERKQAEEVLAFEREQLLSIFDSIDEIIYVTDPDTYEILYINNTIREAFQRDVVGGICYKEFQGLNSPCEFCTNEIIMKQKPMPYRWEHHNPVLNRDYVIVDRIIKWPDGRDVRFELAIDITERKHAERVLRESEEKWRSLVENSPDYIFIVDKDLKIEYMNYAPPGFTTEVLIGTSIYSYVEEQKQSEVKAILENVLKMGQPARYETRHIDPDGNITQYESYVESRILDGQVIGLTISSRNITERRRMEEELQKIEKLESIGILAGGIAHDLNNLLTGVVGNISLARMYDNPVEKDRRLTEAEEASLQIKNLTQQLLTFSKGGVPVLETANIAELLRDSATFTLRGSSIRCDFLLSDDLQPVEIDSGQINQVINNLIINAQQAMPNGGVIRISAENVDIEINSDLPLEAGSYIKVSIEDEGTGIPEDHIQKIFDPFFSTKQAGNGLGLATSYSIIEKHGGHITVESRLGIGTTFYIYLPASRSKPQTTTAKLEQKPIAGTGRILVMDDEKYIRDLAAAILIELGYEVTTTVDGEEAIEIYKEAIDSGSPFTAVILDLTIPGRMGGGETIQRLMELEPETKAIVSSGYSNDPILANFKEHGFIGVVAKPYKIRELSVVLDKAIRGVD